VETHGEDDSPEKDRGLARPTPGLGETHLRFDPLFAHRSAPTLTNFEFSRNYATATGQNEEKVKVPLSSPRLSVLIPSLPTNLCLLSRRLWVLLGTATKLS
jgi:hypothetical protein